MESKRIISEHIVSPEELMDLTGYTLPAKQAKCLREHGIYYIERKDGQIRTTWYHINHPALHAVNNDGFDLSAIA